MAVDLQAVRFAAVDPERLLSFWAALLGRERAADDVLLAPDQGGLPLGVFAVADPKTAKNRAHLDLTSGSPAEQQRTVARALALGGRHVDVGQRPEEEHVVLADPEGDELCVIEPGNGFLAGCGPVGALACDGSREVGLFWAAVLDWPLVWDEGEETAVRSPQGGTKISWGGPPLPERTEPDRVVLELVPRADSDVETEVARLESLGAVRRATGRGGPGRVELADPDGNELWLRRP